MQLTQKLRELNWKRNFANKKIKLYIKFALFYIIAFFLPAREKDCNLQNVKRILIVRNDRIGDMVVTTGLIRNLAKVGYNIYVASTKPALDIIKYNPYVKGTITYDASNLFSWIKSIMHARKYHFDAAILVKAIRSAEMKNIIFCAYLKAPLLIGFNKSNIPAFNLSLCDYPYIKHITQQFLKILDTFNIEYDDMHYDIPVSKGIKDNTLLFLKGIINGNKKFVVLSPCGSSTAKSLSDKNFNIACALLSTDYKIILIGEKNRIKKLSIPPNVVVFNSDSILDVVPLIESANLVVTVDTSIVHIAACFQKKAIAFYASTNPNKPASDKKSVYHYEFALFKAKLEDCFNNKKYFKNHPHTIKLPLLHSVWSPNNKNAQQLLFNEGKMTNVDEKIFTTKLAQALKHI